MDSKAQILSLRVLAIISLTVLCSISPAVGVGESIILDLLEEIRVRMCHPIPKFGLPALDPLQVTHAEIEVNNQYIIDFKGSVTDFKLTGISDFVINALKISSLPLRTSTFDISLPLTAFKSLYTAKGSLAYILNLAGDGTTDAYVKELRVAISWQLKTGITLGIRNLKILLSIGEIFIDFENLLEEERINDFVHALINELGLELLNDIWTEQNVPVEQVIQERINAFLGQYTLADIIKMIGGGNGEPIFGPNDPPGDCKDIST